MNDIVRPLTEDGMLGYDEHRQLWAFRLDQGMKIGTIVADVREEKCSLCAEGWKTTAESMLDQFCHLKRWVHRTCFVRYVGYREYGMWCKVFRLTKLRFNKIKEIPNQYGGGWKAPWYEIEIENTPVTFYVGNRKQVYSIQVRATKGDLSEMEELFTDEDVTKKFETNNVLLHAWNEDKVADYVKKIADFVLDAKYTG